jgi:two-component system NtrC family sensor kinase
LRQVIANLLLNAVEATEETGNIAVAVNLQGSTIELTVEDDGPGLLSSVSERAFEPFFTTKRGGTGLGLAISQAIATAHQGALDLQPAIGRGTRARLRFPRSNETETQSTSLPVTAHHAST